MSLVSLTIDQIKANIPYACVGGPFGSDLTTRDYVDQGVPVIRGGNLSGDSGFLDSNFVFVSEEKAIALSSNLGFPGDIVFTQRGTLGQVGLIPMNAAYGRYVISQSQMKLTVNQNIAFPEYVFWWFRQPQIVELVKRRAITSGVPHINLGILKSLTIKIPSLTAQRKILVHLGAMSELIENNRRRIALLEQSARLLYREWFVHFRFPGHEHVAVVDGIPEGWVRKPLVALADMTMGQSPTSDHYNQDEIGFPFHQGVSNFGERFVEHKTWCDVRGRVANPGDILFSVRAPVGRLNVTLDEIVIGRGLAALRSKVEQQSILFYQLANHFFKEDMIGGGAIFASVTKKDLENQLLLCPTSALAKDFNAFSAGVDTQIRNLVQQNAKLREARDLLIPRLMSGEIEI